MSNNSTIAQKNRPKTTPSGLGMISEAEEHDGGSLAIPPINQSIAKKPAPPMRRERAPDSWGGIALMSTYDHGGDGQDTCENELTGSGSAECNDVDDEEAPPLQPAPPQPAPPRPAEAETAPAKQRHAPSPPPPAHMSYAESRIAKLRRVQSQRLSERQAKKAQEVSWQ